MHKFCLLQSMYLKFGLSEKHTKFEKNLPYGFDKSTDLLSKRQNHEEHFFQIMCASQKVRTLSCMIIYSQHTVTKAKFSLISNFK